MSCRTNPQPQTSLLDGVLPTQERPCKAYVGVTNLKIPALSLFSCCDYIFSFGIFYISMPMNLGFVDTSKHVMIIWPEICIIWPKILHYTIFYSALKGSH